MGLTAINDASLTDNSDLFGIELNYNISNSTLQSEALYNGNIASIYWKTKSDNVKRGYGYTYDNLSRIKQATYATYNGTAWTGDADRYSVSNIDYDFNGNIKTLNREGMNGESGGNPTFGNMDQLSYTYTGNKLTAVNDAIADIASNPYDFSEKSVVEDGE